jgi:hypothetical protein
MSSDFHSPVNNCRFLQWMTPATSGDRGHIHYEVR